MTTFNTDYSNTELLDQELTTAELSQVSGGLVRTNGPLQKAVINGLHVIGDGINEWMFNEMIDGWGEIIDHA
jgi:bacteriocin-like protein